MDNRQDRLRNLLRELSDIGEMSSRNNVFNVNIPDIPFQKIKGIKFTSLGKRAMPMRARKIQKNKKTYYSIGAVGKNISKDKTSDFVIINSQYISITPISIDMCDSFALRNLKKTYG